MLRVGESRRSVVVLVVVAVACFGAGVAASARWLPELADGAVGTVAFFAVCGLVGAAACVIGIDIDLLVRQLQRHGEFGISASADLVGIRVADMLYTGGTITALALVAYLLAPKRRELAPAAVSPAGDRGP